MLAIWISKIVYCDKEKILLLGMRIDIAKYLAKFLECQKVKAKNQHPARLLHPLPILEWNGKLSH